MTKFTRDYHSAIFFVNLAKTVIANNDERSDWEGININFDVRWNWLLSADVLGCSVNLS